MTPERPRYAGAAGAAVVGVLSFLVAALLGFAATFGLGAGSGALLSFVLLLASFGVLVGGLLLAGRLLRR